MKGIKKKCFFSGHASIMSVSSVKPVIENVVCVSGVNGELKKTYEVRGFYVIKFLQP